MGTVFDIKEFAVYDGPGIRTTVFMKGCPLRCRWCHNPEGLKAEKQLMVSVAACVHCGKCMEVCTHKDKCIACGDCLSACRAGLRRIAGTDWSAQALAERLLKDRDVYEMSGGGVTFSGGEPLMQWPFVSDVISRMKGVHCAIETSAFCTDEVFRSAMDMCSLIMMDWKVSDPEAHRYWTGVEQTPVRRHLEMLARGKTPFILRMPIIPGVNDNKAHFETAAMLVKDARALVRVEILPYQRAAGAKYEMVNMKYAPGIDEAAQPRYELAVFEKEGIPYKVFR